MINYWSTPIVTICYSSWSDCDTLLWTTHCCKKYLASKSGSITLVADLNLAHCAAREVLPLVWKYIYFFPSGGILPVVIGVDGISWHEFKFKSFNVTGVVVSSTQTYVSRWLFLRGIENYCELSSLLTEGDMFLESIQ